MRVADLRAELTRSSGSLKKCLADIVASVCGCSFCVLEYSLHFEVRALP